MQAQVAVRVSPEQRSRLVALTQTIRLDPMNGRARAHRASLYRALGDERRAAQDERMALELTMGITLG